MHNYITVCRIFKYLKLQVHKPKAGPAYFCLLSSVMRKALAFLCSEFCLAWPCPAWWETSMLCLGAATCPTPWNVLTSKITKSSLQPEDHYSVSVSPPASKTWEIPPTMNWLSVRETITAFVHSQSRVW